MVCLRRYYKRFGYISTKGITDLVYIPNLWINHFLKDDFLLISYGGKIELIDDRKGLCIYEKYTGYDETVCGNEIMDVMKGARQFSNFDIIALIEQIKDKKEILQKNHPEQFGPEVWSFAMVSNDWTKKNGDKCHCCIAQAVA